MHTTWHGAVNFFIILDTVISFGLVGFIALAKHEYTKSKGK